MKIKLLVSCLLSAAIVSAAYAGETNAPANNIGNPSLAEGIENADPLNTLEPSHSLDTAMNNIETDAILDGSTIDEEY